MDVPYDLIPVEEFEALSIELKPPSRAPEQRPARGKEASPAFSSSGSPAEPSASGRPITEGRLDQKWLFENLGKYPAKTHARKVAKELGEKSGLIYLVGQEEQLYEDSDMGPEFRQRRHFYYITGADFPGCAVTYDIKADHLILWIPRTEPRAVLWYGRTPTRDQCMDASDLDEVRYIKDLDRTLSSRLRSGTIIYALNPDQAPKLDHHRGMLEINTFKLKPAIEQARVIKTDHEIALIRRANAVSSGAHKAVMTRAKHLTNERDIQAIFTAYCLAHGAKHQAYPVIAASGRNASTLHYADNDQPLKGRQLVVLDAGAEWHCYASDVTRTIPLGAAKGGRFPTREAGEVYRVVERMQRECIERVKPGVPFYMLHLHACVVAVTELLALGILTGGTVAEIIGAGTVAAFFPHGLGHHVGLEVHDVSGKEKLLLSSSMGELLGVQSAKDGGKGGRRSKREFVGPSQLAALYRESLDATPFGSGVNEWKKMSSGGRQKLEKNMVVTIEPGIYFCREYIEGYFLNNPVHSMYINEKELAKYWDVGGVRIEDDILVTEDGYENLTWAPKGQEMFCDIEEGKLF